jgi:predicted metal-dependent enzyme (double-stranded beta helix superfamily)
MTITQETPLRGGKTAATATASGHPAGSGPLALLDLLQCYVIETGAFLPLATPDLTERRYELLELTDELEIWAIHWPQGQGLELHDHGGSVGALWVVEGSLEEHYVQPDRSLARRSIVSGGGAAFGPRYVHDVVNTQAAPATSVHAYSPPMESMTFYRHGSEGLTVDRAEYRADPSWAP